MSSSRNGYLLDLNSLVALGDPDHIQHSAIQKWFIAGGKEDWGICPLTEAGFVRVTTNPAYRPLPRTIPQALAVLADFASHSGYRYWPITESWSALTATFASRIFGHQQITDACLLGLVVKHSGVLVTFDKAIRFLAGIEYSQHILVLEE